MQQQPRSRSRRRPGWVRPAQAAAFLGLHQMTLSRYVRDGLLRCYYTPGGHRRFAVGDLERLQGTVYGGSDALEDAGEEARRVAATARAERTSVARQVVLDFAAEIGAFEHPNGQQAFAKAWRRLL